MIGFIHAGLVFRLLRGWRLRRRRADSFDVEISDEREADLKAYRELFPALSNTDIEIDILPPFDRARAQLWWETNGESDIPGGQQPASAKSASL